jgi:hypothetical protein
VDHPLISHGTSSDICTASKCDDISCGEVISALNLEDDPQLEEIEDKIHQNTAETRQRKANKTASEILLEGK